MKVLICFPLFLALCLFTILNTVSAESADMLKSTDDMQLKAGREAIDVGVDVDADDFIPDLDGYMPNVSDTLSDFFTDVPPNVLDGLAVFGIVFGIIFTFFGAKFLVFGSFVLGSTIGGCLAQVIVSRFPEIPPNNRLVVITICAVSFGLVTVCVYKLAKILVGIAMGLMVAAILYQYGIGQVVKSDGILVAMIILEIGVCVLVSYKSFNYAVGFCTSLLGSAFFVLGVNRFIAEETEFTVKEFYNNPRSTACHTPACWSLFAFGVLLASLGTFIQWRRMCEEDGGILSKDNSKEIKVVRRKPAETQPDYVEII